MKREPCVWSKSGLSALMMVQDLLGMSPEALDMRWWLPIMHVRLTSDWLRIDRASNFRAGLPSGTLSIQRV